MSKYSNEAIGMMALLKSRSDNVGNRKVRPRVRPKAIAGVKAKLINFVTNLIGG